MLHDKDIFFNENNLPAFFAVRVSSVKAYVTKIAYAILETI